jgi:hypothetical protein
MVSWWVGRGSKEALDALKASGSAIGWRGDGQQIDMDSLQNRRKRIEDEN